ncbi:MAG: 2-oxoacid:acceptor oxidoreductase subunit alpha [Candidatus Poribacteria bacterium]
MQLDFSLLAGGEAGQGVQTIGQMIARVFVKGGRDVFVIQDFESRIRRGHNFTQIRVKDEPVYAIAEVIDLIIALDKPTIDLHSDKLVEGGALIFDSDNITVEPKTNFFGIPLGKIAIAEGGNRIYANTVAVAAALGLLRYDIEILNDVIDESFGKRPEIAQNNIKAAKAGYEYVREHFGRYDRYEIKAVPDASKKMLLTGNEAVALGAIAAGVKFMTAYPMSPSTGIITYLAGQAEKFGLVIEQAEDEIAAVNLIIGAACAGVRAMTATSGGGFALMVEGLGLAGVMEVPIVIVEAQRPGPATGLPTRTAQADLEFVLHASQDEFPRVILAPGTVEEAFYAIPKAFNLAERYQLPAIVLSDQHLADSSMTVDKFDLDKVTIERHLLADEEINPAEYKRYKITSSGVSPRALPGQTGALVINDSHEHKENGHITEDAQIRTEMVLKRLRKLEGAKAEIKPPTTYGPEKSEVMLVDWGTTYGSMREAADILNADGMNVSMMHFSEIWPFPAEAVSNILKKAKKIFAVEGNATAQLAHLIRAETGIEISGKILKFDGRPFSPGYIVRAVKEEG